MIPPGFCKIRSFYYQSYNILKADSEDIILSKFQNKFPSIFENKSPAYSKMMV